MKAESEESHKVVFNREFFIEYSSSQIVMPLLVLNLYSLVVQCTQNNSNQEALPPNTFA
jgi:hypothetical protein